MSGSPFELDRYFVRRKLLKIFGAGFHVYDGDRLVGYSSQKAFRLKEDIRLYTDETMQQELLVISARQVLDFAACYDIRDPATGEKVGAARRKFLKSMIRDSWEVLGPGDEVLGTLHEDSTFLAFLRRFVVALIPQTFHLDVGQGRVTFRQRFNPVIYKLDVEIGPGCPLDRRLVFGVAVLIAAIEGRQG